MQNHLGNRVVQRMISGSANDLERGEPNHADPEGGPVNQDMASYLESRAGGGKSLDESLRTEMEEYFDHSLAHVRLHTDQEADLLNQVFNAKAFTFGKDIFFRGGNGPEDKSLLAHELAHVIQQNAMTTSGPLTIGPVGDHYEQQADYVASQVGTSTKAMGDAPLTDSHSNSISSSEANSSGHYSQATVQRDWLDDLGNTAGVLGVVNDVISSVGPELGSTASNISTGVGGVTGAIGLGTGLMGLLGEDSTPGERILGGMSTAGGLASLAGTASSLFGTGASAGALSVGGAGGLSATMGAATSAGGAGLASMGAGALATSAGALLGSGAAGYGLGTLLDRGFGGLMDITGASGAIDEARGISRPEGQSGDYSLSGLGAMSMTGLDQAFTGAMRSVGAYDTDRPAYTQSLGWRLAEVLPSWMQ